MKAGSAGLNYMVILKPDDFKQAFPPGVRNVERQTRIFTNVDGATKLFQPTKQLTF